MSKLATRIKNAGSGALVAAAFIGPDSICVHGDNVKALTFVTQIRSALKAEGVQIAPLAGIV